MLLIKPFLCHTHLHSRPPGWLNNFLSLNQKRYQTSGASKSVYSFRLAFAVHFLSVHLKSTINTKQGSAITLLIIKSTFRQKARTSVWQLLLLLLFYVWLSQIHTSTIWSPAFNCPLSIAAPFGKILLTNIGVFPPAGLSRVVMLNPRPSFPGENETWISFLYCKSSIFFMAVIWVVAHHATLLPCVTG